MQKNNKLNLLDNIVYKTLIILMGLTPIFFLPITTEFYSLNKQLLLLISAITLLIVFSIRIFKSNEIKIVRSALDIPFMAFLIVVLFSTAFSISVSDSVFGSSGRWFNSLMGFSIIGILYYLISWANIETKQLRKALIVFIGSITFNSIISLFSYFQLYLVNTAFGKTPNFTLTGSTTTTSVLAAIAFIIAIGLFLYAKNQKLKSALLITSFINLLCITILSNLISINNLPVGYTVLIVGLISIGFVFNTQTLNKNKVFISAMVGLVSISLLINTIPAINKLVSNQNFPYEITLPIKYSWDISTQVLKDSPILGTGPSTFYLNYTLHKSPQINNTELWNVRFDKPTNEVFNILIEFGILGFLTLIAIIISLYKIIRSSVLNSEDQEISKILTVAVISSLSVFLFTYATITTSFFALIFIALLVNSLNSQKSELNGVFSKTIKLSKGKIVQENEHNTNKKVTLNINSPIKVVFILPIIILVTLLSYLFYRSYIAEYYTRKSVNAASQNKWQEVYNLQEKAIQASPTKDVLYNRHAQTILILANSIAAQPDLTEEDRDAIINFVAQAVNVARFNTENVNNLNVRNWETQALIFRNIFQAVEDADDWAITSYNVAIRLDPNNPRLRLELGGVYYAQEDYLSAASQFNQAIALKPDYANAHYNFAQALYLLQDYNNAKRALEITISLLPEGSEDIERVESEINIIDQQIALLEQNSQENDVEKPTIQELQTNNIEPTNQEPLNTIGEVSPELTTEITEEIFEESNN